MSREGGRSGSGAGGLLEREELLRAARSALERAREGQGSLHLVRGHAGMGKTRLLRVIADDARSSELEVLEARGGELEREFAFGVAIQLFGRTVARAGAEERRSLLAGAASLAEPLVRGAANTGAPPGDTTLFAHLHGLHWLTSNVAERRPLLLAIDDVHWSDEPSLRFLLYLLPRVSELPVAVFATARPAEPGAELVAELAAAEGTESHELAPLSRAAVEGLLEEAFGERAAPEFAEAAAEVTAGNPFLVMEVVAELRDRGTRPIAESAALLRDLSPDSLTRQVVVRLTRLGDAAASLARIAAVLGDGTPLNVAAQLAGIDTATAAAAADALAAAEILRSGDPLAFVHPIVRAAIYSDLGAGRRGVEHLRAAELLRAGPGGDDVVAGHLLAATPAGSPWVVEELRAAARRASASGAPASAIEYLARAVAEPPPADERAAVLRELGEAQSRAGQPAAAETLREAIDVALDPEDRASSALALGRALYAAGALDEAVATFHEGLAGLGPGLDDLRRQLEAEEAIVALIPTVQGDVQFSEERITQLMRAAQDELSVADRAYLAMVGLGLAWRGDPAESALSLVRRAWGDGRLLELETSDGTSLYAVSSVLHRTGEFEEDDRVLSAAVDDARRRGSIMGFATASYSRGWQRLEAGRVLDAIADLEAAVEAHDHGWEQFVAPAYGSLALCYLERDLLEEADAALNALDPAKWGTHPTYLAVVQARGQVQLAQGDAQQALEAFELWGSLMPNANPAMYAAWRSWSARALSALGRRDEAVRVAAEEVELTRAFGAPPAIGVAVHALGVAQGGDEGLARLHESVAVLERSQARLALVQSLVDLGMALRSAGERARAREALSRGLALAEDCGALRLAARAAEELRVAGARPRRRATTGAEALTASERRVAEMAASGMSNPEIAQALFVTRKAIEYHLGNVYRKLDIGSRKELPDALRPC